MSNNQNQKDHPKPQQNPKVEERKIPFSKDAPVRDNAPPSLIKTPPPKPKK